MKEYRISFIGAGKVSGVLCRQLYLSGCNILSIVSKSRNNGPDLASSCNALWSQDYSFINSEDIIIVAVSDDSVQDVLKKIKCGPETVVVHTAGSLGLDIFPENIAHKGVFYPLQTFSQGRKIRLNGLPFFLEASDDTALTAMTDLAELLGGSVYFADTLRRQLLHVAAVFVCNFTNHMLTSGKQIARMAGFPFDVLKPLIDETVKKAEDMGPENSQTGPAYRFDKGTLKRHIDLLSFSPELQRMYEEITKSIMNTYNSSNNDQF